MAPEAVAITRIASLRRAELATGPDDKASWPDAKRPCGSVRGVPASSLDADPRAAVDSGDELLSVFRRSAFDQLGDRGNLHHHGLMRGVVGEQEGNANGRQHIRQGSDGRRRPDRAQVGYRARVAAHRDSKMKPEFVINQIGKPSELLGADVSHLGGVAKAASGGPDVGEVPPDRRDRAKGQQPLERRDEQERNFHARRPLVVPPLEDLVSMRVAGPRAPDLRPILGRTLIDLKEAGFRTERGDNERSVDQSLGDHQHLLQRFAADREQ